MTVNMIIRRKGDHEDPRLEALRKEGVPLLMKHGAQSHRFGYYQSGAHAGQILIVLSYPGPRRARARHEGHGGGPRLDARFSRGRCNRPLAGDPTTVVTEQR